MSNVIWLSFSLPLWYFSSLLHPFDAGFLSLVPAIGIVCLVVGACLTFARRNTALSWVLASVLLSQVFVALAGFLRGEVSQDEQLFAVTATFLCVQLVCLVLLLWYSKGARAASIPLAFFGGTYALFAAFVAVMAFSDTWL